MAGPEEPLILLTDCVELIPRYSGKMSTVKTVNRHSLSELFSRLTMLVFAFRRIVELAPLALEEGYLMAGWIVDKSTRKIVEKFDPTARRRDPLVLQRRQELDWELLILTEWFYHTAWRVRELIHPQKCGLPLLCGFEAPGVRDVRNHILQHPEKYDIGRDVQSHGVSEDRGPTIGNAFWKAPTKPFTDAGLYINGLEFARNLRDALTKALAANP